MNKISHALSLAAVGSLLAIVPSAQAQGAAFTYQGRLNSGTNPANGSFDVQFTLFTSSAGGSPVAGPVTNAAVAVSNGLFATTVNLGAAAFTGASNWLELAVRTNGAASFSPPLSPRQQLTPTPYAVYAESANAGGLIGVLSGNASGLTSLPASQLTGTVLDGRLSSNVALLNANQTFTSSNAFNGPVSLTGVATGVAAGSSIDPSAFMRLFNSSSDGNSSSPDVAGIAFGHNSTRQAIVGGTFGSDFLDFYTGGLLTAPKMRIDFNGALTLNDPRTGAFGSGAQITLNDFFSGSAEGALIDAVGNGGGFSWRNGALELRPVARFNVYRGSDVTSASQVALTVIGSSGRVGIGTDSPNSTLQVNGTVTASAFSGPGSGLSGVALLAGGNAFTGSQSITSGSLGLGTTSPNRPLAITGSGGNGEWLSLKDNSSVTKWHLNNNLGGLNFGQSGVTDGRLFISTNGGVGIGTTTPSGRLSVSTLNGTVSFSDDQFTPALVMTGGPVGGVLRVRNKFEMWPNTGATAAGSLDVRGTNGVANITLDGSNGEVTCVALNMTSDRNAKESFSPVNPRAVLDKVASLPISEWQYKEQTGARHIGPMAQDFHQAFTLGHDEKHISVVDEGGVALAAIQGLNQKLDETRAQNEQLKQTVDDLKQLIEQLQQKLAARQ